MLPREAGRANGSNMRTGPQHLPRARIGGQTQADVSTLEPFRDVGPTTKKSHVSDPIRLRLRMPGNRTGASEAGTREAEGRPLQQPSASAD